MPLKGIVVSANATTAAGWSLVVIPVRVLALVRLDALVDLLGEGLGRLARGGL
jgi:hypothetical protein